MVEEYYITDEIKIVKLKIAQFGTFPLYYINIKYSGSLFNHYKYAILRSIHIFFCVALELS